MFGRSRYPRRCDDHQNQPRERYLAGVREAARASPSVNLSPRAGSFAFANAGHGRPPSVCQPCFTLPARPFPVAAAFAFDFRSPEMRSASSHGGERGRKKHVRSRAWQGEGGKSSDVNSSTLGVRRTRLVRNVYMSGLIKP